MDRQRHPSDSSINLIAGVLAAAILGIFAVVFIYNYSGNYSGDRASFAGNNEPQTTSSRQPGASAGRTGSATTGQSALQ